MTDKFHFHVNGGAGHGGRTLTPAVQESRMLATQEAMRYFRPSNNLGFGIWVKRPETNDGPAGVINIHFDWKVGLIMEKEITATLPFTTRDGRIVRSTITVNLYELARSLTSKGLVRDQRVMTMAAGAVRLTIEAADDL